MKTIVRASAFGAALASVIMLVGSGVAVAEDKVIATVNGKPITERDIELAEAELQGELRDLPPEYKRRALAEFMIESQLFADAAAADKLNEGADYEARLKYWQRRAARDAYFDKAIKGEVGEGAAKFFYEEQVKKLKPEEEVQARHILVEKEEEAKDIASKIAGGADFATLAKEHSKDPGSKDQGGLLGYFSRGQMVPQFESAAFELQKGQVSGPVQSQFGWHIIKVEDRRQKPPPSFEDVKERIINSMMSQKAQAVAGDLRTKGKIEYVDADLKKQVEDQAKQADAQKDALQKQMEEQIKKMEAEQSKGEPKTEADKPK